MAMQKKTSVLAKIAGEVAKVTAKNAELPPDYGRQGLPGGISNGIAQLVKCGFATYQNGDNVGQPYLRAEGRVVSPKSVQTPEGERNVEGEMTSIMIPLCTTTSKSNPPKTTSLQKNIAKVQNFFKTMGIEGGATIGVDGFEAAAEALVEAAPFFKFTTSQSAATPAYPNPRVWENWFGTKGLEDYSLEVEEQVEDETGSTEAEAVEEAAEEAAEEEATEAEAEASEEGAEEAAAEPAGEFSEFDDLDSLVAAADDDEAARAKLMELAVAAGHAPEAVDNAPSWAAVRTMINNPKTKAPAPKAPATKGKATAGPSEAAKAKAEKAFAPKVGEVCRYAPKDKAGKAGKPVDVEVTAVYKDGTCDLKNSTNPKVTYKKVKVGELKAA